MSRRTLLLDTTLSDGIRAEDVAFAPLDAVRVLLRLDELGVDFVEMDPSAPGASFVSELARVRPRRTRVLARARLQESDPARDPHLKKALGSGAAGVVVQGLSLTDGRAAAAAVRRVRDAGLVAVVRFEDFVGSYQRDARVALAAVRDAALAGAEWIVLRDGSASAFPGEIGRVVAAARKLARGRVGIGAANDTGLAVATVLEGVAKGAGLAEGAMNGYGPRCGVADLVQVAANLSLRARGAALEGERLRLLGPTARFVAELANHSLDPRAPYVGDAAFLASPAELPLDPRALGARGRSPLEDPRGHSVLAAVARARGAKGVEAKALLSRLRELESRGFRFEGAEASFELALRRLTGGLKPWFEVLSYRVHAERHGRDAESEATCRVKVGAQVEHTAAEGAGPVHALDLALRKGLERFYPSLRDLRLLDFKVRMLKGRGTSATARVLAVSSDGRETWGTSGVSDDLVEATFHALVDAITWKLLKDGVPPLG